MGQERSYAQFDHLIWRLSANYDLRIMCELEMGKIEVRFELNLGMGPNLLARYLHDSFRMLLAVRSLCMQTMAIEVTDLQTTVSTKLLLTNLQFLDKSVAAQHHRSSQ